MMLVAIEIRGKSLYVPMLCDTGSPKTFISLTALKQFGISEEAIAEHVKIKVGQSSIRATILDDNCPIKYRGLNIIGGDLLRQLLPDIVPILVSSINNKNKND